MDETERLLIERACERLSNAYARIVDFRDYDAVPDVFTADAELRARSSVHGHDAITRLLASAPRELRMRHVMSNGFIDVLDADNARGIVYVTSYSGPATGDPLPPVRIGAVGHYEDRYVRTAAGWRIARRVAQLAFHSPNTPPATATSETE